MAKQLDLRQHAPPTPPPAAGAVVGMPPPDPRGLPYKTAGIYMPQETKDYLMQLGWKEGDPIPGDLGERLQRMQTEIRQEQQQAATQVVAPNTPPPKLKLVDINQLTPAHRAEIDQALKQAKQQQAEHAAILAQQQKIASYQVPGADPSVNQAIAVAAQSALEQPKVTITREPQPAPRLSSGDAQSSSSTTDPPPVSSGKPDDLPPVTTPLRECPRCLLDLAQPYEVTFTEDDKRNFLVACLGGKPFTKEYTLLGGQLHVTFRDLPSADQDTVLLQMRYDASQGRIASQAEWFSQIALYRLAAGLDRIVLGNELHYQSRGSLSEIPWDAPQGGPETTKLPAVTTALFEQILPYESIRSVVGIAHREFENLKGMLEKRAAEPDFWKGIELPALWSEPTPRV